MTREEATNCLADLLDAYNDDWHGDYFYENSDVVCDAVLFFMENRPRWISVDERLPEESGVYLVYGIPLGFRVFYYGKSEVRSGWAGVTHWMPLPEPPEVEV